MTPELEAQLYSLYRSSFEKAERERRWSVFEDVPWVRARKEAPAALVECAETFFVIETFLPDFVKNGFAALRTLVGPSWFLATWAYEKSKHQLALREWLLKSGHRSETELATLERSALSQSWPAPFASARQMLFYGCIQEMSTFVTYAKHREEARKAGDECLRTIYDFIARDEIAHARFLESAVRLYLEDDRAGTIADMATVLGSFVTPGKIVLPDYEARMRKVREAGLDRDVFIQRVYVPVLKHLGVTRREIVMARALTRKNLAGPAKAGAETETASTMRVSA